MNEAYDVIVIGAGNAGLVAAANTSKEGLRTLLLEKHNIPGGCATSFRRGRFEFEPSLHELCSVGTAKRPNSVYRVFADLGAKVDWQYEHNVFRAIVKGEDGYDVTLKGGIDGFCDSLEEAVPGCRDSVKAYLELKPKINAAIDYIYATEGHPNGLKMLLKHGDFMRVAGHSVEEVLTALGVPKKAQNIIGTYWGYLGVPTDELNAMHFLNMLYDYVVDGAAMPHHRSHELSLSLADVIYRHGGEIRYNSEVTGFLYDDSGRAVGVEVNGKEKLYAKELISNVIPHNVYDMSGEGNIPEYNLKLANAREFGISVATVYLGLDCTADELGMEDYTVFIQGSPNPRIQYDRRLEDGLYIVNCLNRVVPDSSPEGTCTLFFTIPVFGGDIPGDLKPEQYKRYKNDIARKYIEDAEKVLHISIMPHIEEISVATPVTFARYLGTPEGTIYGYKLSGWDNLMARTAAERTDYAIPGLNFCGGHYIRGDGYSCAYLMGDMVGKRVARRLKGGA